MMRLVHQRMTVEVSLENILQERDALIRPQLLEAEPLPGLRRALDDASAGVAVEAVGMEPDPAGIRLLERECEGVENLVGAQPNVLVPADLYVCSEMVAIELAHPAVDAVAGDDQVGVSKLGRVLDLASELNVGAEIYRTRDQNLEQTLATYTKTV